ncbi:glycoside hydrolase superfamily [Chytriomyces sp. MP71]|nr:glycoside hydrolase superfamily [Chytriomyces sp. MP71]
MGFDEITISAQTSVCGGGSGGRGCELLSPKLLTNRWNRTQFCQSQSDPHKPLKMHPYTLAVFILLHVAPTGAQHGATRSVSHNLLWPKPQIFTSGNVDRVFEPTSVSFSAEGDTNDGLLKRAWNRLMDNVYALGCRTNDTSDIRNVYVSILNSGTNSDERYKLETTMDSVVISADSIVGGVRALETLTQLIMPIQKLPFYVEIGEEGCVQAAAAGYAPGFIIPDGPWSIQDWSTYEWRGLTLDTSRNYIPVSAIMRTLDGMAASKLNVFHWHIVDATSFPLQSTTYPDLINAAYNPFATYSHSDISTILAYAADRGIRVIPEIDTPSHTESWSASANFTSLVLCQNAQTGWPLADAIPGASAGSWFPLCVEPPCGTLNIADPRAARGVAMLLLEIAEMFPDVVMHLGGDELRSFCFASSEEYLQLVFPGLSGNYSVVMPSREAPTVFPRVWEQAMMKVYQTYVDNLLVAVRGAGKSTIHWEDIVLENALTLPSDAIIQVWNGWDDAAHMNSLQKVLALDRYRIVDSNQEVYYLDCGSGKWLTDSLGYGNSSWKESYWCRDHRVWQHIYNHDPRTSRAESPWGYGLNTTTTGNLDLIIGAQVTLWGEKVDASNLDVKIWPRAAAMAEALWSSFANATDKDLFDAEPRLTVMRERLISRGIANEALHPAWCNTHQIRMEIWRRPIGELFFLRYLLLLPARISQPKPKKPSKETVDPTDMSSPLAPTLNQRDDDDEEGDVETEARASDPPSAETTSPAKRKRTEDADSARDRGGGEEGGVSDGGGGKGGLEGGSASLSAVRSSNPTDDMTDNLTCPICRALLHIPCTAVPCMHTFCGGCVCEWIKAGNNDCPVCRKKLIQVARNHQLNTLANLHASANPHLARSEDEKKDLDAKNKVYSGIPLNLATTDGGTLNQGNQGLNIDEEEEEEEEEEYDDQEGLSTIPPLCDNCPPNSQAPDGFSCDPLHPLHTLCSRCSKFMPDRHLALQRCKCCSLPFCHEYYAYAGGCAMNFGYFQQLKYFSFTDVPFYAFKQNQFERQALKDALVTHHIPVQTVFGEGLAKLEAGTYRVAASTCLSVVDGGATVAGEDYVCQSCAGRVFAELAYLYRRDMDPTLLPDAVTGRTNCWYGHECRTQSHNSSHAGRLNHICENIKQ